MRGFFLVSSSIYPPELKTSHRAFKLILKRLLTL